jgi:hypothetical protein
LQASISACVFGLLDGLLHLAIGRQLLGVVHLLGRLLDGAIVIAFLGFAVHVKSSSRIGVNARDRDLFHQTLYDHGRNRATIVAPTAERCSDSCFVCGGSLVFYFGSARGAEVNGYDFRVIRR